MHEYNLQIYKIPLNNIPNLVSWQIIKGTDIICKFALNHNHMTEKKPTETPMMKQFFAVKAEHPEAVLLFRCGDV